MELCERVLERGVFAQGIRPPTVPEGSSRLRLTVMATHRAGRAAPRRGVDRRPPARSASAAAGDATGAAEHAVEIPRAA